MHDEDRDETGRRWQAEKTARAGARSQAQQIDERREASDPFKLPKQLRADVDADVASLADTDLETSSVRGDTKQASGAKRRAMNELLRQFRGDFRFLQGINEGTITDDQRSKVYETYGWVGGENRPVG